MEIRQLRYFVAVVELGGFGRAAEACNVSQPAISASISSLEKLLEVPLLERGGFGARATSVGLELYRRAKLILSDVERATDHVSMLREGERGSISVGAGLLEETTVMPAVMNEFSARWPRVNVSISVGLVVELYERLSVGELDLVVTSPIRWDAHPPNLRVEVLGRTRDVAVAAASHPMWVEGDVSLAALANYRWMVSARAKEAVRRFLLAFEDAGVPRPETLIRTDSIPIMRRLLLEQNFLCVVSTPFLYLMWNEDVTSGRLRIIRESKFAFPREACLAMRADAIPSKAVNEMAILIRREVERSTELMKSGIDAVRALEARSS